MSEPFISIILPVYKRSETIKDLLDCLENQNYPKNNFELIIVDNSPVESMIKNMIEGLKKSYSFDILYIYENKSGVSRARNIGIIKSKGEFILLFTEDVSPIDKNFLNEHMKMHQKYEDAACLGYITWHPEIEKTVFNKFLENRLFYYNRIKNPCDCGYKFFFGTNMSLKKRWFEDDLFDERFVYGYEDTELGYRLQKKGLKIVFNKKASVYHKHFYSLESYLRRQRIMGDSLRIAKSIQSVFIYTFYKKCLIGILLAPLAIILKRISGNSPLTWKLLEKYNELKGMLNIGYKHENDMKNLYNTNRSD